HPGGGVGMSGGAAGRPSPARTGAARNSAVRKLPTSNRTDPMLPHRGRIFPLPRPGPCDNPVPQSEVPMAEKLEPPPSQASQENPGGSASATAEKEKQKAKAPARPRQDKLPPYNVVLLDDDDHT